MFATLTTLTLALGLASAAPAETRQDGTTIDVQLKHSTLNAIKEISVPLNDIAVPVEPSFAANIANSVCHGGCRIGFHCTLYGPAGIDGPGIEVGPGEHQFIFDAFATITAVSCGGGLPAKEKKRQEEETGGLFVSLTNSLLAVTETIRLNDDGVARAVDFDFTVSRVTTGCAEICIPELAYHCELRDRALQPVGNITVPGQPLTFPEGKQPFIGQVTCFQDPWGLDAADAVAARQAEAPKGTVVFEAENDHYEGDLVLDELVLLPDNIVSVFWTEATVVMESDPRDRPWSCHAYARGREELVDLGVFWANNKFIPSFEGGLVYAWECK